jgi:GNAT superfamily N-acetyltransferase
MRSSQAIAQRLSDLPRWVEVRDLLLEGCELLGLQEEPELSFLVRDADTKSIFVVGTPAPGAVEAAIQQNEHGGSIIATQEQASWLVDLLPGWTRTRIIVYTLPHLHRLPSVDDGMVTFLDPRTLPQLALPSDLREELEAAANFTQIAATFVAQQPVAFCYAGAVTETLWDISIDTVPEHRRQGHAGRCVAYMIRYMLSQGKHPVWQAVEANSASWRLAQKLGFVPIDELALFEAPA